MMCVFGRVMSQFGDVRIQSIVGMSVFIMSLHSFSLYVVPVLVFAILSYHIQIRRISLDIQVYGSRIVNFAER